MSPPGWSREETEALQTLFGVGLDDNEIADRLAAMFKASFSRSKVIGKRLRLGLYRDDPSLPKPVRRAPQAKIQLAPAVPQPAAPSPVASPAPIAEPLRSFKGSKPPRPLPAAPHGEAHTVPLPLMQRRKHQCGWPLNDGGPFLFCAQPKGPDEPNYCEYHQQLSLPKEHRRRGRAA